MKYHESEEWKSYLKLMKARPESFKDGILKIITDDAAIDSYYEKTGKRLGVVYESEFHLMLVDLVEDRAGKSFSYERLLPKVASGAVVIVPIINGKYVMVEQFRHALRKNMLAFPRGYGEEGLSSEENLKKELKEELGCDNVTNIKYVGKVIADSGILGNSIDAYLCDISKAEEKKGYEGIVGLKFLDKDELSKAVEDGEIEDGYTKMNNVGGIAQTEAQKSSDLFMKCRYMDEITAGKGIVFATGNEHKMKEIRAILGDLDIEVISMKEAGADVDVEENGETFEENALIKARAVSKLLPDDIVLADDSGLVIDALNGEPGVHSARFMGHDTSYDIKNKAILDKLSGVADEKRSARFVCAIAMVLTTKCGRTEERVTKSAFEGRIGYEIKGENGFGYDPIFYVPDVEKYSAELSFEEKNERSHRGGALRKMKEILREEIL